MNETCPKCGAAVESHYYARRKTGYIEERTRYTCGTKVIDGCLIESMQCPLNQFRAKVERLNALPTERNDHE